MRRSHPPSLLRVPSSSRSVQSQFSSRGTITQHPMKKIIVLATAAAAVAPAAAAFLGGGCVPGHRGCGPAAGEVNVAVAVAVAAPTGPAVGAVGDRDGGGWGRRAFDRRSGHLHPFAPSTRLLAAGGEDSEDKASAADDDDEDDGKSDTVVESYRSGLSDINRRYDDEGDGGGAGGPNKENKSVVFKFGGSSIANAERVDHVAHLIKDQIELGYRPRAVVCSAMGKTTNTLLSAGDFALEGRVSVDALRTLHMAAIDEFDLPDGVRKEVTDLLDECEDMLNGVRLLQELSPKSLDQLVSYGERCSVRIMSARLNQIGVPAQSYDAWEVGIRTDSNFGDASLLQPDAENEIARVFGERIDPGIVAVVTGFIGKDPKGRITTLGRGGSDLTATAIGAACDLDEVQVWKDVDGILTSDPRLVPNAVPVSDVSFEEASELAYFGAKVLHPIAMQPAMKKNIPVRVKNSYNPSHEGTVIQRRETQGRLVTAITCKRGVNLLDIVSTRMLGAYGFLSTVFRTFEEHKLSVDVLASSEVSVSLTLDKKQNISPGCQILRDLAPIADVTLKTNRAILTLIADVERSSDVLATVFRVFSSRGIKVEMLSQGASKVNISFILKDEQLDDAILQLHKCFFEDHCVVDLEDRTLPVNGKPLFAETHSP